MLGVIVNPAAVVAGGLLGLLVKSLISENIRVSVTQGMALAVVAVGIMDAVKTENALYLTLALAFGGLLGAALGIENKINKFGDFLQKKVGKSDSKIGEGFVTATLIFCVGGMVVYGSINAGLGDSSTLLIKSVMDGITAAILASALGAGVILSSVPIFLIQGTIALFAGTLSSIATPEFINQLSGIGGVMVFAIGLNMLGIAKIKVGNLIPAILGAALIFIGF